MAFSCGSDPLGASQLAGLVIVSFISFYCWRITSYSTYDYFKGVSFETISAFADNAAVIHYRAVPDTNKQIDKSSVYLVDSGGQYMCVNNSVYRQTQRYARVRFVSSAVILSVCPGTYISATVSDTDRREILHDGTYRSRVCLLLFWGRYPQKSPKSKILAV